MKIFITNLVEQFQIQYFLRTFIKAKYSVYNISIAKPGVQYYNISKPILINIVKVLYSAITFAPPKQLLNKWCFLKTI